MAAWFYVLCKLGVGGCNSNMLSEVGDCPLLSLESYETGPESRPKFRKSSPHLPS